MTRKEAAQQEQSLLEFFDGVMFNEEEDLTDEQIEALRDKIESSLSELDSLKESNALLVKENEELVKENEKLVKAKPGAKASPSELEELKKENQFLQERIAHLRSKGAGVPEGMSR